MKIEDKIQEALNFFKKKNHIERLIVTKDGTKRIGYKTYSSIHYSIRCDSGYLRLNELSSELDIWKHILEKNQTSDILGGSFFEPIILLNKKSTIESLLVERDLKD